MISIGCDVLACHPFVYVTAYPEPSLCSKLPHKIVQDILDRQYVSTVDIDFSLKSYVTWIKIVKIIYIWFYTYDGFNNYIENLELYNL